MPLQNRVDPFGEIHAVLERGMFTGNRGVIHDPATRTLLRRRWTTKAWLVCDCGFQSRKRDVMGRNAAGGGAGWTNLFFLDEVTALAAGHRPCFFCRRERAKAFAECVGRGLGIGTPTAGQIDERLHRERMASGGRPTPLSPDEFKGLPEGAMVSAGDRPHAICRGSPIAWSFGGYSSGLHLCAKAEDGILLVSPSTVVAALRGGYLPAWHHSAAEAN